MNTLNIVYIILLLVLKGILIPAVIYLVRKSKERTVQMTKMETNIKTMFKRIDRIEKHIVDKK